MFSFAKRGDRCGLAFCGPRGGRSGVMPPSPLARITLGDIGQAIERHATRNSYSIVRDFCGHGIGREMHEAPQVLHFGKPGVAADTGCAGPASSNGRPSRLL